MSSKYDKGYQQVTREEEGLYHRREIEGPRNYTTKTKEIIPVTSTTTSRKDYHHDQSSDDDNFSEWTTSKKKVHHKTRQVETRVSRQLVVEDGKVIADSGPQVVTRIKEDNKVEECEKEKAPKNKAKFEALENAPEGAECSGRILGEKKEIQKVSREIREENMQYHDERYKELTGKDMHQRAIKAPHELITINDQPQSSMPRGKMVHYSNRGKKYIDTDEILEVAKLAIDGSITKEKKHKKHHEEFSEDEKPDEKGEAEALRHKPEIVRSSRRGVDYVNDFDNISDPINASDNDDDDDDDDDGARRGGPKGKGGNHRHHDYAPSSRDSRRRHKTDEDEAFPRYEIDPLLSSLRDEDFKPATSTTTATTRPHNYSSGHHAASGNGRYREHRLERKEQSDSSDSDKESSLHYNRANVVPHQQHQQQHHRPHHHHHHHHHQSDDQPPVVEIPEEYRHHKERLLSSKGKVGPSGGHQRERSFSPAAKSHLSHRSSKSASRSHKEDASVQAHLTDEEEERKSMRSSSSSAGANQSHAKTTKQLQRQSTVNSHRNYYYGNQRQRSPSIQSCSSTSLDDPKERLREQGARSKDSGFKSPHSMGRTATPNSGEAGSPQQIYSVSSKSKKNRQEPAARHGGTGRPGAVSPSPSVGQRSVKTTTTTMSAGLTDRPQSRGERAVSQPAGSSRQTSSSKLVSSGRDKKNSNNNRREGASGAKLKKNSPIQRKSPDNDEYICDHYKYKVETSSRRDHKKVKGQMLHQEQQQQAGGSMKPTRLLAHKDVQCSMDQEEEEEQGKSGKPRCGQPAATTIKVPYKEMVEPEEEIPVQMDKDNHMRRDPQAEEMIVKETGDKMRLEEDIARLRQRLANINSRTITLSSSSSNKRKKTDGQNGDLTSMPEHFDYRAVVASVQPAPVAGRHQHTVAAYNVKVIEHDSPFHNPSQHRHHQSRSVSELSNSIAQLELQSSDLGSSSSGVGGSTINNNNINNSSFQPTTMDNNNEANFNLDNFMKHKAIPIMTHHGSLKESDSLDDLDDDRISIISSCSLRSSRTYDIRYVNQRQNSSTVQRNRREEEEDEDDLNDEKHFPVGCLDLDEMGNEKKPAAWIYDIRDGSSTTIIAPPKPEKPEPPEVDAKDLAQSRGGRSYYLELIETPRDKKGDNNNSSSSSSSNNNNNNSNKSQEFQGNGTMDNTLYSRWSSQGALSQANLSNKQNYRSPQRRTNSPIKATSPGPMMINPPESRKSRQILPASIIYQTNRPAIPRALSSSTTNSTSQQQHQLPAFNAGPTLGNRSKSISCLVSSTRPTKYSIYGGLRKSNGGNKPVPRLSYSRAIGPKSQRQIDNQPKTPSRYLKMK